MGRRALLEHVNAPAWEPRSRRLIVEPLALFAAAVFVGGAVILSVFELRGMVFAAVTFAAIALIAGVVVWTQRAVRIFDAEFLLLLQREDIKGLQALMQRAWWARTFGPRWLVVSREGVVAMLREDFVDAESALERAWVRTAPEARTSLIAPLCRTKFRVEKMVDMRELAEDWHNAYRDRSPAAWYLAYGRLESEGLSAEELDELVVNAGAAEDATDEEVRRRVFAYMAARTSTAPVSSQPEETRPQPTFAPDDLPPETGPLMSDIEHAEQPADRTRTPR